MRVLIVEDDPIHANRFEMLVEQLGYEVAGIFDNAFDAIACYYKTAPDLALIDINLIGNIDGIQLAVQINQHRLTPIVFVSSMRDDETFKRALEAHPAAFVLKPFDTLQLQRAIEMAVSALALVPEPASNSFEQSDMAFADSLFIKVRNKLEKVKFEEILLLESEGKYVNLHTTAGRKFAIRIPMIDLECKLPESRFARTHRSYLINLQWLQNVDLHEMVVNLKGRSVPLSKGFREQILARVNQV